MKLFLYGDHIRVVQATKKIFLTSQRQLQLGYKGGAAFRADKSDY
jgi:hypothetical protein